MNQVTKEMKQQVRENLAKQLYGFLTDNSQKNITWRGTKTQLVELVYYLYLTGSVTDDYGTPLSLRELVRRICNRFGIKMVTNVSQLIANINKCQGIRSHTLLSMSMYDYVHRGHYHNVKQYISA